MDLPLPFVIGRDLAGVVEWTGAGVTRFDGRQGSFAELAAVREELLYALPDPVDFAAMAALAHSGLAACLVNRIVVMSGLGARPVLPAGALYVRDISITASPSPMRPSRRCAPAPIASMRSPKRGASTPRSRSRCR